MNTASLISVIVTVLAALLAAFSSQVDAAVAAHPTVVSIIVGVWGVIAHYLPAPSAPTVK